MRKIYLLAVNVLGWGLISYIMGMNIQAIAGMVIFSTGILISVTDIESYIIPNRLILILLLAGIIYCLFSDGLSLAARLCGFAAAFGVTFLLSVASRSGIGGGDIKLAAVMGFWLGTEKVLYALFIGSLAGGITGLGLILFGIKNRKDAIPFGPFLVIGFLVMYFFADKAVHLL